MFMGLCPGDFHMTSALDAHRQESQRDFGDPIGITSRALIEGLFGIQPNLIANSIRIRPGFPTGWNRAALHHKDFDLAWKREALRDTFDFTSRLAKSVPLTLILPARTTILPTVLCNGTRATCAFDPNAVGSPQLVITLPAVRACKVSVEWHGLAPSKAPAQRTYRIGETLVLPQGITLAHIDDPQHALTDGRITSPGFHTVFANIHNGDCLWTLPISFEAKPAAPAFAPIPALASPQPRTPSRSTLLPC